MVSAVQSSSQINYNSQSNHAQARVQDTIYRDGCEWEYVATYLIQNTDEFFAQCTQFTTKQFEMMLTAFKIRKGAVMTQAFQRLLERQVHSSLSNRPCTLYYSILEANRAHDEKHPCEDLKNLLNRIALPTNYCGDNAATFEELQARTLLYQKAVENPFPDSTLAALPLSASRNDWADLMEQHTLQILRQTLQGQGEQWPDVIRFLLRNPAVFFSRFANITLDCFENMLLQIKRIPGEEAKQAFQTLLTHQIDSGVPDQKFTFYYSLLKKNTGSDDTIRRQLYAEVLPESDQGSGWASPAEFAERAGIYKRSLEMGVTQEPASLFKRFWDTSPPNCVIA